MLIYRYSKRGANRTMVTRVFYGRKHDRGSFERRVIIPQHICEIMNINPGDYILWGLTQTENNIWVACFVKVDDLFPLADIEIDISQATEAIKTGSFPIEKFEKAGKLL